MLFVGYAIWLTIASSWCAFAIPTFAEDFDIDVGIARRENNMLPVRYNILDLQKDNVAWPIYIQALIRLQARNEEDKFSYFQLAGIHGRPYVDWNSVHQSQGSQLTGYCTHGSVLFLTWHRPYLALFEQTLLSEAQEIAKLYPNSSTTYVDAAKSLRIPFWDWGSDAKVPLIMSQPTIQIESWNGSQTVNNPLYQYSFQKPLDETTFPPNDSWDGWLATYSTTVRGARTHTDGNNPAPVDTCLENSDIMGRTWRALMKPTTFNEFGTTATSGMSIEDVHNSIHGCIGGSSGHMSLLSYSAFDPIFWLHHTNIDRLLTLWQAIQPTTYVEPLYDGYGTYTIPSGATEDVDTNLTPFTDDRTGLSWTSASIRETSTFDYTYPEIQGNLTSEQLKSNVTAAINRLYNPSGTSTRRSSKVSFMVRSERREWSIALSVSKFAVEGKRFRILVFLGDIPEDPEDWTTSKSYIGSCTVLPPPIPKNGPYPNMTTHSEIDLVKPLQRNGVDAGDASGVIKYLAEKLAWKVQKMDGSVVPNERVSSLSMDVQDEVVTLPARITDRPVYSQKTTHINAIVGNIQEG